jgi:hypothetical protein
LQEPTIGGEGTSIDQNNGKISGKVITVKPA